MFGVQMIGVGPGSLGVLVAADRLGLLADLLARGVALIDRLPQDHRLGASGLAYTTGSNSRGGELIAGFAPDGAFAVPLGTPWGIRVRAASEQPVRLLTAARFFHAVALHACRLVAAQPNGAVLTGREVATIAVQPGGTIRTSDADGRTIAISRALVLSPGGWQAPTQREPAFVSDRNPTAPVWRSDLLLRRGGGEIVQRLRAGTARRVAIIGGSHSGFSLAALLVQRAGRHLAPASVAIIHQVALRHFYRSLDEARRLRVGREPLQVCPDTGSVNRFTGLRGDAAAFSRRIHGGEEQRVVMVDATQRPDAARDAVATADLVIDATGYDAPPVAFVGVDGRPLDIVRQRGFPVDDKNRLQLASGGVLEPIYVTGLARRYAEAARPELRATGGGAGVFQLTDGTIIAQALARTTPSSAAARRHGA